MALPTHYQEAIEKIKSLQNLNDYQSAFIFGSTARDELTKHSDLDVRVVIAGQESCDSVSHPTINGIKLDISFNTFDELTNITNEEISSAKRIPMLAESIIVFDKTGALTKLKEKALKAKPKILSKKKHHWIQFMVYHATDKAKRHLVSDPQSSLYSLHSNIGEILKFHYQINRRWWISDKRLLKDIRNWDPKLNQILEKFLSVSEIKLKYLYWKKIVKHVLKPIGGVKKIIETNCSCKICRTHLDNLSTIK